MKKLSAFGITIIFVTLCSLSCQKKEFDDVQSSLNGAHTYSFQLTEGIDSKVSLATNGKTAWEAGDQIFIHGQKVGYSGDEYYSRIVTLSAGDISADGKTATFTMDDIVADKSWGRTGYNATLFAAYPASAISTYSNSDNWYHTSSFKDTNNLLLAGCNDVTVNDGHTFAFTNLCGALSFIVSGDFDSYVFSGNSGETVGYEQFAVRVDSDNSFGDKNDIPHFTGDGKLTTGPLTSLSGSVTSDGSTMNFIYFPGGVNLSGGFVIKFLKAGNIEKVVSTKTGKNIAIGKYLNLGDVTSNLIDPPAHVPAAWTSSAENLVVSNAANSYIVYHEGVSGYSANAGKAFKIPAVKGKSNTSVGVIASVSILWETYNGTSDAVVANSVIADVDYDNDYVYFKMPAHSVMHTGNALIAAKDASDAILWSWHIWVPSSVVNPITNTKFSPTAVMDRNLGAIQPAVAAESTVPVEAYGLYYQWGRKDPFFTKNWKRNASVDLSFVNPGNTTTEGSIQNPTVWYYHNDGSTSPATNNWNSSEITTLWDDSGKTIYDPCPEGYKTSPRNSSKAMWKDGSGSPGWTTSSYGWFAYGDGDPEGYGNVIVFPYAGYASGSSLSYGGARSVVWSATYYSLERGYAMYVRHDKESDGTGIYNYPSYYKSYLASVRCVAE